MSRWSEDEPRGPLSFLGLPERLASRPQTLILFPGRRPQGPRLRCRRATPPPAAPSIPWPLAAWLPPPPPPLRGLRSAPSAVSVSGLSLSCPREDPRGWVGPGGSSSSHSAGFRFVCTDLSQEAHSHSPGIGVWTRAFGATTQRAAETPICSTPRATCLFLFVLGLANVLVAHLFMTNAARGPSVVLWLLVCCLLLYLQPKWEQLSALFFLHESKPSLAG